MKLLHLLETQSEKILDRTILRPDVAKMLVRSTPRKNLSFEVALAEHCNLNCAWCNHFSPVAKPELADLEETSRDFERLSSLFQGRAQEIRLLGGEPLLHPQLPDFLKMARNAFPTANIVIVTNGILLPRQTEEFWTVCEKNQITISPTRYPVKCDYSAIEKCCRQYHVKYRNFSIMPKSLKYMFRTPLDKEGRQNEIYRFLTCPLANTCIYLSHGRLYTCPTIANVRHLNHYFGTEFEVLPEDSIDIHSAASGEEILNFLATPVPFCRYCMSKKPKHFLPWRRTKKDIFEWVE